MELLKKIGKGFGIGFFAFFAFVAFAGMHSVAGGIVFLLGAVLFTPLMSKVTDRLPDKINGPVFIGALAMVLCTTASFIAYGDNKKFEGTLENASEESVSTDEILVADANDMNTSETTDSSVEESEYEVEDTIDDDEEGETAVENSTEEASSNETVPDDTAVEDVTSTESAVTEPDLITQAVSEEVASVEPVPAPVVETTTSTTVTYVLNTNTGKAHIPTCSSVDEMKPENRQDFYGTAAEAQALGYDACGRCHPW